MRKKGIATKLLALGLLGTLTASMLTSCGGNKGGKESEAVSLTEPGSYPIVKDGEDMTLSAFTMTMPNVEDLETNDFTKFLEDKTGIKIEFQTGGRDDWEDKLNLILQGKDYPDIIFGVSPNIAKYGVKEGLFIKLDDYINEDNTPNYLKTMKDNNYDMDITRETDGHIYSLASVNDCYHCSYARKMWVNTKYLDEMGVDVPKTTDEFLEVCKKYLEYKPDGIAIAGAAEGWHSRFQDFLINPFVFMPIKSQTLLVRDSVALNRETKKMEAVASTDGYKEALEYLHKLYELGAIYDGNFTQTGEQMKTLINQADAPVLFFTAGTISDAIDSASNNELYRQYAAMAPLSTPGGKPVSYYMPNSGISSGSFVITDKCKNPEAALRWIDYFYSELGDLTSQYGAEEGKDWVLNPEGKVGLDGQPAGYEVLNTYSAETQNHDWQDIGIRVAPAPYRLTQAIDADVDPYSPDGLEKLLFDATKELYEPYGENGTHIQLNALKVTDEERSSVSTIGVEIEKLIEENSVAFITGAKDIDKDWDSYTASLTKAGLEDLIKVYETAYDRMYNE